MKLSRLTPRQHFQIRKIRWKNKSVGLAKHRIGTHNTIEILHTSEKDGRRYYPDTYYISGERIKSVDYELDVQSGTTLVIVPIADLEPLEEGEPNLPEPKLEPTPFRLKDVAKPKQLSILDSKPTNKLGISVLE